MDKPTFGYFDGLRGRGIEFGSPDAVESCSHQGACDEDVRALLRVPAIEAEVDRYSPDELRQSLKEWGSWDEHELRDHERNRERALWLAACGARSDWE